MSPYHRHATAQNFTDCKQTFEICMCKLENSGFSSFIPIFCAIFLCNDVKSKILMAQKKSTFRISVYIVVLTIECKFQFRIQYVVHFLL